MNFYKVECPSENETIYLRNINCKLYNIKKGSIGLTAYADLILPLTSVTINFSIIFRSMNRVMMNTTFEYCGSFGNLPPYVHIIFALYKQYSKNLIHECPYSPTKRLGIESFPLNSHSAVMTVVNFQRGDYKSVLEMRDKKGRLIVFVHCYLSVSPKRPHKNGS